MNIDEALIERIIREVVSQVVAEKAAGSGQNRSASGNNQNSMQSVNLGQIEQLVKNVASGDRQTSSGGQTSNAGGYHPEEPVHDVDIEEDITSREVKKRPLIDQPQDPEALERMMRLTTARIGVGCARHKAEDSDAADSQGRSCQSKGCGYAGCASGCY